jgi:hypothetical protein
MDEITSIIQAANCILEKDKEKAVEIIEENIPHRFIEYDKRSMSIYKKLEIFIKDGFIDRYSGKQLLFPNVLRIISLELGDTFPYHPNWKMSDCHISYWNLWPTYDHVIPIARGGLDVEDNIVATSMLNNAIKSNWTLQEINFNLYEPGNINEWNGMITWYKKYIKEKGKPELDFSFREWHKALEKYEKEYCVIA